MCLQISIKKFYGGKNQNMKNRPHRFLNAVQTSLKDKTYYTFEFEGKRVKVGFSDNQNSQTFENALVKIAMRRIR